MSEPLTMGQVIELQMERIAELDAEIDALSELLNTKDVEIMALREHREKNAASFSAMSLENSLLREKVAKMPVVVGYVGEAQFNKLLTPNNRLKTVSVEANYDDNWKHPIYIDPPPQEPGE